MHALQTESQQGSSGQDSIAAAADAFAHGAHLLCRDELEVTDIADAMIVGRLFDNLFDRGVVLVTTSNAPDGLYSNGPNRELFVPFVERLKQHTFVVKLSGEHDYRSDGTEELSAYLCPFTPQNTVRFDRLWQKKLAHPGKSAAVSVHGHKLKLERTFGQALRVTFDDVCKRALSADDHLALAHRFVLKTFPSLRGSIRMKAAGWLRSSIRSMRQKLTLLFSPRPSPMKSSKTPLQTTINELSPAQRKCATLPG